MLLLAHPCRASTRPSETIHWLGALKLNGCEFEARSAERWPETRLGVMFWRFFQIF